MVLLELRLMGPREIWLLLPSCAVATSLQLIPAPSRAISVFLRPFLSAASGDHDLPSNSAPSSLRFPSGLGARSLNRGPFFNVYLIPREVPIVTLDMTILY